MPSPAGPKGLSVCAVRLNLKRGPVEEPTVHELEGRQTVSDVRQAGGGGSSGCRGWWTLDGRRPGEERGGEGDVAVIVIS
jgi:hypothetical protein